MVAAEQEEAAGGATRLPVFLQTLLATEELTIPGPKVEDDNREALRARHCLGKRFVPSSPFLLTCLLSGRNHKRRLTGSEADKDGGAARKRAEGEGAERADQTDENLEERSYWQQC